MLTPSIRLPRHHLHRLRLHQNHVVIATLHHRLHQTLQSQVNQLNAAVRINIIINRAAATNPNMGIIAMIVVTGGGTWMV